VLGDPSPPDFDAGDEVDRDWERYLLEYLWGSIWTRPGLDVQSRCLCTLTALTVVGTDGTIGDYVRAALRLGYTKAQIRELFFHLSFYAGLSPARRASAVARQVFGTR
jgi:alkylhydroperoxidase/carboxymuconolactone decarboxylase family protein YurZ